MRNGGCVPGHSISAAFHQSRGRAAALLDSVFSICTSSRTNNWQSAYRLTHTITFAHTRRNFVKRSAHKRTSQLLITCIFTRLNVDTQSHAVTSIWRRRKHETARSSCFPPGDIHNFQIRIFLWSLQAFSTSEHNKRGYTIHNEVCITMWAKWVFLPFYCIITLCDEKEAYLYVLYCGYQEWVNPLTEACLGYMRLRNRVHRNNK